MQEMLLMGAFVRRQDVPILDAFFQAHSFFLLLFFSFFYILFLFLFCSRIIRGHCPGLVISAGSVTHKYFQRNEKVGS
jgi:hypothetical protein